jgi:hypothetical protein
MWKAGAQTRGRLSFLGRVEFLEGLGGRSTRIRPVSEWGVIRSELPSTNSRPRVQSRLVVTNPWQTSPNAGIRPYLNHDHPDYGRQLDSGINPEYTVGYRGFPEDRIRRPLRGACRLACSRSTDEIPRENRAVQADPFCRQSLPPLPDAIGSAFLRCHCSPLHSYASIRTRDACGFTRAEFSPGSRESV